MKTLPPLIFKDTYYEPIEKDINSFLSEQIYKPILKIIRKYTEAKFNSKSALMEALQKGRVQYVNGSFSGKFNSRISKAIKDIGGRFDKRTGMWNIARNKLPIELQETITRSNMMFESLNEEVKDFVNKLNLENPLQEYSVEGKYLETVSKIERDWRKTAKSIEVVPEMTPEALKNIAENYSNNMKLYIKDLSEKNIKNLRQTVEKNAMQGFRAENLVEDIHKNYGVSKTKAKFLARQETSLLMSQHKEQRYKSVGIRKYRWSATRDKRLRDRHAELDGEIFTWDNPPIVDKKTKRTAHPGEDYNCRCRAIPIVD